MGLHPHFSRTALRASAAAAALVLGAGMASAQTTRSAPETTALRTTASSCPCAGGERLNVSALRQALLGRTVCASLGSERWTDFHRPGAASGEGELWSYRRGPGHPVDPTTRSGGWLIEGSMRSQPVVTYIYGQNRYSYAVCQEGQQLHFCGVGQGSRNITGVTTRDGQASCD